MTDKDSSPGDAWRRSARKRFRLLVLCTLGATPVAIAAALAWLHATGAPMKLHLVVATALGVGLTVILGGVLMALVFLSGSSGDDGEGRS